jgi:hypothetical protein
VADGGSLVAIGETIVIPPGSYHTSTGHDRGALRMRVAHVLQGPGEDIRNYTWVQLMGPELRPNGTEGPHRTAHVKVVTLAVRQGRGHDPQTPMWLCRIDGQPWPCGAARVGLLAGYGDDLVHLVLFLSCCLTKATPDLQRAYPETQFSPGAMHNRFIGWIPQTRRRHLNGQRRI